MIGFLWVIWPATAFGLQVSPVVDRRSRLLWRTIPHTVCTLTCKVNSWNLWGGKYLPGPWWWKARGNKNFWFWKKLNLSKSCTRKVADIFTVIRLVWSGRGSWLDWGIRAMAGKGLWISFLPLFFILLVWSLLKAPFLICICVICIFLPIGKPWMASMLLYIKLIKSC